MSKEVDITIGFSGWLRIRPENIKFVKITELESEITGSEWLKLSHEDRCDYLIEDIIAAVRDSDYCEWEDIDVIADEPFMYGE
jgi:hypothetical protein